MASRMAFSLQEPVGKAIIGILIHMAMQQASPHLVCFPLWAFMPARSTLDAICRVCMHCREVRQFVSSQRSTPHSRVSARPRLGLYGGLQLCLDMERALDSVNRGKLFQQLRNFYVSDSVSQLLAAWHEHTCYFVQHEQTDCPIQTGRGVRQGCKAAPGLWNFT